jgi:hypothetical protein
VPALLLALAIAPRRPSAAAASPPAGAAGAARARGPLRLAPAAAGLFALLSAGFWAPGLRTRPAGAPSPAAAFAAPAPGLRRTSSYHIFFGLPASCSPAVFRAAAFARGRPGLGFLAALRARLRLPAAQPTDAQRASASVHEERAPQAGQLPCTGSAPAPASP